MHPYLVLFISVNAPSSSPNRFLECNLMWSWSRSRMQPHLVPPDNDSYIKSHNFGLFLGIYQDFDQPRARQEIRKSSHIALGGILFHTILRHFKWLILGLNCKYILSISRSAGDSKIFIYRARHETHSSKSRSVGHFRRNLVDFLGPYNMSHRKI